MWKEWKEAFRHQSFRVQLGVSILGLAAFIVLLPYFFNQILLPKPGVRLSDPILSLFKPRDCSTEIFVVIYLCTLLSILLNSKKPKTVLLGAQVYVVVNFIRMLSLYLITLEAPEGIIPLNDPFLTHVVYGQPVYVKDLFFSGHVSTMFLLFLIEERLTFKWFLLLATVIVAVLLAWQRVHYTLDMLVAPVVTWFVFRFFLRFVPNDFLANPYHGSPEEN